MRFDLRKPCPQCPFRPAAGAFLHVERAREIAQAVTEGNVTFSCHKHLHGRERSNGSYNPGHGDQMCAGAMAFVEKLGAANQMLQIAERLGIRDPNRLLPEALADVYESVEAMAQGHAATDALQRALSATAPTRPRPLPKRCSALKTSFPSMFRCCSS